MPEQLHYRTAIIGVLPEGWGKAKIDSRLVDNLGGFACARTNIVRSGIPHLRPFNITQNGQVILTEDTVHIPTDFRDDLEQYYLEPGDVLFNNTNSVELVGKTGIVLQPLPVAFSNHINRLRVKDPNRIDAKWLALALQQLQSSGFFANHCRKWIGQAGFSVSELAEVEIPLPNINTQRRIVARIEALLTEVREMRALQADIRDDTDRLVSEIVSNAFREGITQGWKWTTIGELIVGQPQYGTSQKSNTDGIGLPVLRMGNIQRSSLIISVKTGWRDMAQTA
jgi:type I restriction enzyme S subunit